MPNDGHLANLCPLMMRETATRRQVLVDNPARLYWF
jgi:predicted TIM-barrel fold metal-dependent hydrolase